MKRIIPILAIGLLLAGCATFTPSSLKLAVQSTSMIGTMEAVKHQPKTKPKFVAAANALDVLVQSGSGDVVALQNALTNLPINEFKGPQGQIIMAEGAMILEFIGHDTIQLENRTNYNKYVFPVATGLRDGIRQGVALNP